MDWLDLLAITARLLDAHDSRHTPGATASPVVEERPGPSDGVWFDIATQLLEYLNEEESATNESWVPLDEFILAMTELHDVTEDDVRWLVSLMSTPTRLSQVTKDDVGTVTGVSSTKSTALIERPRFKAADKARLTRQGRTAVKLAKGTHGLLYSQYDAQKILLALQLHDFQAAFDQADAVVQEVRGFSQELTRLLEQPVSPETRAGYQKQKGAYLDAIQSVSSAAEQALNMFSTNAIREAFRSWSERQPGDPPGELAFRNRLRDTVRSVQTMSARMQTMIAELVTARREVVGNIDFAKVSLQQVFSPSTEADLWGCLTTLGPWQSQAGFPDAIDLIGILPPVSSINTDSDFVFDDNEESELTPTRLARFLETHGETIRAALLAGQSVSLSQAIRDGMLDVDGAQSLSELAGVYVSPDWLGLEDIRLRVTFREGGLRESLSTDLDLIGDELVLEPFVEEVAE